MICRIPFSLSDHWETNERTNERRRVHHFLSDISQCELAWFLYQWLKNDEYHPNTTFFTAKRRFLRRGRGKERKGTNDLRTCRHTEQMLLSWVIKLIREKEWNERAESREYFLSFVLLFFRIYYLREIITSTIVSGRRISRGFNGIINEYDFGS